MIKLRASNSRHTLGLVRYFAVLTLALVTALALVGCGHFKKSKPKSATRKPAAPVVAAPAPRVLDYGNGWYHPADGVMTIEAVARKYQRDPELVALLNRAGAKSVPRSGAMLYIPPTNSKTKLKSVLTRIQANPGLVPLEPYETFRAKHERPAAPVAPAVVAAAPKPTPRPVLKVAKSGVKSKTGKFWIFDRRGTPSDDDKPAKPAEKMVASARGPMPRAITDGGQPAANAPQGQAALAAIGALAPKTPDAAPRIPEAAPKPPSDPRAFMWPVEGQVVRPFKGGWSKSQHGIEIGSSEGETVRAARAGRVIIAQNFVSYGNLVYIDHGDGWGSAYGYNRDLKVKQGDQVAAGQAIGSVGRPSQGSSPKLFFQVRHKAVPVDPEPLLRSGIAAK